MPSASNQTLQHFNSQCCGSEDLQGLFPILLFHRLAETFLQLGVNLLQSEQTAEPGSQRSTPLPWNSPSRRVLKQVRQQGCLWTSRSPVSKKSVPSYLGPLREIHIFFLLSSPTSIHLSGQDFKEKDHAWISFSQKKEIILEIESSHQSIPPGELNDPVTPFICSTSEQINLY